MASLIVQPNTTNDGLLQLALRMFTLNTTTECRVMFSILRKVVSNIISHPDDSKFRTVKLSNKTVQQKIVSIHGGIEFLLSMKFRRATEKREQLLRISESDVDVAWLELGLSTLDSITLSSSSSSTSSSTPQSILASCSLHIVLPTGHTLRAGFMLDETVDDVYNFVDYCRTDGKRQNGDESFVLSTSYPVCDLVGELRQQTIRQAGLAPRSKLLIKKGKRPDAPGAFQDKPEDRRAIEEAEEMERDRRAEQERNVLQKKRLERVAVKKERERAIQSFQDDRKETVRRADFEMRKAQRLQYEAGLIQRLHAQDSVAREASPTDIDIDNTGTGTNNEITEKQHG